MGEVIALQHQDARAGLTKRALRMQNAAALAAVHDHEVVPRWYPWPDEQEDKLFPFYAVFIISAYAAMTLLAFARMGMFSRRG